VCHRQSDDRRSFLFGSAVTVGTLTVAGCVTQDGMSFAEASKIYGPVPEEKFPIPAVDISKVDPKHYRRTVRYDTKEVPGTHRRVISRAGIGVPSTGHHRPGQERRELMRLR
jgi:hypothetical protein